jgi:hypothetical protein
LTKEERCGLKNMAKEVENQSQIDIDKFDVSPIIFKYLFVHQHCGLRLNAWNNYFDL